MAVIGLTGRNGAGKGEVAEILGAKGFAYRSLSDALRAELGRRGQEVTRDRLIAIGRELRARDGSDVLARMTVETVDPERNTVIDSVRNPGEVRFLREHLPRFELWVVGAPAELRFKRISARGRESDPQSLEAFVALERAEATAADESGQNLDGTASLGDRAVENDGTLKDLHAAVAAALKDSGFEGDL